jgi:hypothetical protein
VIFCSPPARGYTSGLPCSNIIMLRYIVCKHMDIHGYMDIRQVWIWSDIYAHGYFHGCGMLRLMDLDLDLVLQYSSKSAPLPSTDAP